MSDAPTGGNEVKTGASSDIHVNFGNCYDSVKVPSVFEVQNVDPISCSGYSGFNTRQTQTFLKQSSFIGGKKIL